MFGKIIIYTVSFLLCFPGTILRAKNPSISTVKVTAAKVLNNTIERIDNLSRKYRINVYYRHFIAGQYAVYYSKWKYLSEKDNDLLSKYAVILEKSWRKYPEGFVKKSGIRALALVKNLKVQRQRRFAMPDPYGEMLYLDIQSFRFGESYCEHVIHHEFYHMIEQEFNGDMYYKDPEWNRLNDGAFRYGEGGKYMRDPGQSWKEHPVQGFVNGYATSALEEDKAEVFAYLFTTVEFAKIRDWIRNDRILQNKYHYMIRFLNSKSSIIDESYFIKMHDSINNE